MNAKEYNSFIFSHIPKCAGTSIREFLYNACISNKFNKNQFHIPGFGGIDFHKNISELSESEINELRKSELLVLASHSMYNVDKEYNLHMDTPFYFTILREPQDRFISHYNFFYKQLGYWGLKNTHINNLDESTFNKILHVLSNLQLKYCINPGYCLHVKNQKMNRKPDSSWVKMAINTLGNKYGFVGIFEEIDLTIEKLKYAAPKWFNLSDTNLKIINKTTEIKSDESVSKSIITKIREFNKYDLMLYNEAQEIFYK